MKEVIESQIRREYNECLDYGCGPVVNDRGLATKEGREHLYKAVKTALWYQELAFTDSIIQALIEDFGEELRAFESIQAGRI